MFLDIDSLKKQRLVFDQGEYWFAVDGERVLFDEISEFYRASTDHYTNRVYQGTRLRVELRFSDGREAQILEVDSNHEEHYRLLHHLAEAIEAFRRQRLEDDYRIGKEVTFDLRGKVESILLNDSGLWYDNEQVGSLRFSQRNGTAEIEFVLPGRAAAIATTDISDSALFMSLAQQVVPVSVKPASQGAVWLNRAFWLFVLCFGINGWLDEYGVALWMGHSLVAGLSVVARILLVVALVLRPVFWLVGRFNQKMIARQRDRLNLDQ